jgi:adenine-specific DNA-methyltransferase
MISIADQLPFVFVVDQILTIAKDEDHLTNPAKQAKVKEIERQIDYMVYELYGLTQEEIAAVEGFVNG